MDDYASVHLAIARPVEPNRPLQGPSLSSLGTRGEMAGVSWSWACLARVTRPSFSLVAPSFAVLAESPREWIIAAGLVFAPCSKPHKLWLSSRIVCRHYRLPRNQGSAYLNRYRIGRLMTDSRDSLLTENDSEVTSLSSE